MGSMGSELVSHVLRVMQSRPCENLNSLALQEEFGMEAPQSPLGEKTTPSRAQLGVWEAADYPHPLWMLVAGTALGSE